MLGFDFYTNSRTTNNPDTLVPAFSHYSSANSGLVGPTTSRTSGTDNYTILPSNHTVGNSSYALTYINSFYQNAAYATKLIRAFDSYTSTDGGVTWVAPSGGSPVLPPNSYATTPGGDVPLFVKGSATNYATTVNDVVAGTNCENALWELDGYSNYTNGSISNWSTGTNASYPSTGAGSFAGYTKGPGYYGKTFFIWPPDPRVPLNTGTSTAWSNTTLDAAQINLFLTDFGYTAADFSSSSVTTTLGAKVSTTTATTITVASSSLFPTSSTTPSSGILHRGWQFLE